MSSVDVFASLLKLFSALAVVLGLMIGGMYLFRGFVKRAGQGSDEMIRILSSKYLGPKTSILLMDILGQIVVVGVAGGRITMLTTISDAASLDRLRGILGSGGSRPSVADQLANYRAKLKLSRSGESSILKEEALNMIRSLTPQQAAGNTLAAGFNAMRQLAGKIGQGK